MMPNPWKDKVLKFNKHRKSVDEKANDMQIIADKLFQLPMGQLKKILDEEVLAILDKYGVCKNNIE